MTQMDFSNVDLVILNIINKHKERYDDEISKPDGIWDKDDEFSISFEYGVINGKVLPFTVDSHYGSIILSDEDSEMIVKYFMDKNIIPKDAMGGWISVNYDEQLFQFEH